MVYGDLGYTTCILVLILHSLRYNVFILKRAYLIAPCVSVACCIGKCNDCLVMRHQVHLSCLIELYYLVVHGFFVGSQLVLISALLGTQVRHGVPVVNMLCLGRLHLATFDVLNPGPWCCVCVCFCHLVIL